MVTVWSLHGGHHVVTVVIVWLLDSHRVAPVVTPVVVIVWPLHSQYGHLVVIVWSHLVFGWQWDHQWRSLHHHYLVIMCSLHAHWTEWPFPEWSLSSLCDNTELSL